MKFQIISEGYVSRHHIGTDTGMVCCPRCVIGRSGDIYCSFIAQSALGINDFKPMICKSSDGGNTWSEPLLIWPDLVDRFSIFGSISSSIKGEFFFYGTKTYIENKGESFWSEDVQGIKQNELVWSQSLDSGESWTELKVIPLPDTGSAEAPGPLCKTTDGRLLCCYAPYNTFNPLIKVRKDSVICLWSNDHGNSWNHSPMITFPYSDSNGAESWLIELSDGRLLGTSWHIRRQSDEPNAYAISYDSGETWSETLSTGIMGQSTSLAAFEDGRALFVYNQRKYGEIGVWMALVNPSPNNFGTLINEKIWGAKTASKIQGHTNPDDWTNFSFGEPSALMLPDNQVLVVLWACDKTQSQIIYVKVELI